MNSPPGSNSPYERPQANYYRWRPPDEEFRSAPGRRRPPMAVVLGAVVTLALAGTGVGLYFGLRPGDNPAPSRSAPTATTPLDHLDTIDVCGLLNPDAFRDANTDVHIQPETLNGCTVSLQLQNINGGYTVHVTLLPKAADPAKIAADANAHTENWGQLHIAKLAATTPPDCLRVIYRDDGAGVQLRSTVSGDALDPTGHPKPGYDPCAPADLAVTSIVTAVETGSIDRIAYPADSLGGADLCADLSAADADTALHTTGLTEPDGTDKRDCALLSPIGNSPTEVDLTAVLLTPKAWQDHQPGAPGQIGSTATRETIGNRGTVLGGTQIASKTLCFAWTAQKSWSPWPGHQVFGDTSPSSTNFDAFTSAAQPSLMEIAQLQVNAPPGTPVATCLATARTLAQQIWPRLPQSS